MILTIEQVGEIYGVFIDLSLLPSMLIMWDDLDTPLSAPVLKTIKSFKYESMTPVQESCIPLFMKHKDVAAEAVTGSGKTLAFVIPVIEMLLSKEHEIKKYDIAAIIISPTRELAVQIFNVIVPFLKEIPKFTIKLLIGGTNPQFDIDSFQEVGGHIIVATPGRLEDFLQRSFNGLNVSACTKSLEVLVLDEADRLLHMGFKKSLTSILGLIPKQRRTGIFSATLTQDVEDLIRAGMRNPVRISIKQKSLIGSESCDQKTPVSLKNFYMVCDADMKLNCLCEFIKIHKDEKIILFFSTCACVDYFCNILRRLLPKFQILSIHRKKDNRNIVIDKFNDIKSGVLVCTDVMGRGIDLPNISWVIQFDPPVSVSNFVHRCGRTARIGNMGNALVMLLENEQPYVEFIKLNQKVPLELFTLKPSVNVLETVKSFSLADRAIYEKGLQAFVSFIQSYAKHECNLIFRVKDINLGKLAHGFGLLHLPKMPEINKNLIDFVPTYCDYKAIPFRDKQREKLRQEKLAVISEKKKNDNSIKFKKNQTPKQNIKTIKKSKRLMEEHDLDELMNDARLVKKFKSGKISKEEFDGAFKD